jgi:phage terminase large subunit-like protein
MAKDYTKVAIAYAKSAVSDTDRKKHGLLIQQAAARFLSDLDRCETVKPGVKRRKSAPADCGFYFSAVKANNACDFIEKLPHVEGKWASPEIVLHPAQVFFLVQLFGFRNANTHARRYTSALYCTSRKSGKSTIAAAIMLYCMCLENEDGAQLISAATTYDQAGIIFNLAKRMVEKTPDLREAFGLEVWARAVSRSEIGGSFKAVHAKASTQDGLNPSHVALDEIHAHKSPDLLNVLTSAAGARGNPLWLYTTTEGYENPGPWAEIRRFCKRVLSGDAEADHFLFIFFAIDEENKSLGIKADDEFDESCWIKANPLIDVNPFLLNAIRKEAIEAKSMPSKLAEFRIKRLNRQSQTSEGWIDLPRWQLCRGEVDLEFLKDYPCYGGLDLASSRDMTAFRLVWDVDGVLYTHGIRWVTDDAVKARSERGAGLYGSWVEQGFLKNTGGRAIDYEVVERDILEACERFDIRKIGYDRWNASDLTSRLIDKDVPLTEFIQGTKSYNPAMKELERAYITGKFCHAGDPVLQWCASNVVARTDVNLSTAPDKKRSADKIDDIAALLMAVGMMLTDRDDGDLAGFLENPVIV